jgi:hypothetical protein
MRAVTLPDGTEVILSDTVGFISDLPTQLVAAFRATLEEVLDADLICHVRDISTPEDRGSQAALEVWNKMFCPRRSETRHRCTRSRPSPGWSPSSAAEHVSEETLSHADGRLFERGCGGRGQDRGPVRWTDREAQAFRALGDVESQATRSSRSDPTASSAKPASASGPEPSQHQRPQHDGDGRDQERHQHRVSGPRSRQHAVIEQVGHRRADDREIGNRAKRDRAD